MSLATSRYRCVDVIVAFLYSCKILTEAELEPTVRRYEDCETDLEDFNAEDDTEYGDGPSEAESVQDDEFGASEDLCRNSDDDSSPRKASLKYSTYQLVLPHKKTG